MMTPNPTPSRLFVVLRTYVIHELFKSDGPVPSTSPNFHAFGLLLRVQTVVGVAALVREGICHQC